MGLLGVPWIPLVLAAGAAGAATALAARPVAAAVGLSGLDGCHPAAVAAAGAVLTPVLWIPGTGLVSRVGLFVGRFPLPWLLAMPAAALLTGTAIGTAAGLVLAPDGHRRLFRWVGLGAGAGLFVLPPTTGVAFVVFVLLPV